MGLLRRGVGDVTNDVISVGSTFTSYDRCMSRDYCKIPLIVICVILGIIVFSILWCVFRCCLCGIRCCTCCCGGCGGGGGGSRHERRRDRDHSDRDMHGSGGGGPGFGGGGPGYGGPGPMAPAIIIQQQPPYQEPPKYAYFDRGNDDALPIMPSLEKSQRIEVSAKEEHEMAYMGRGNGQQQQEYGYVQSAGGVRYPSNGLQHPPPVRGYAQDGYNEQYQDPYSGRSGDARYQQETGVTHHGGNMYQESPGYHQEQQQWNGHPQNGGNNYGAGDHKTDPYRYQGSTQHQNPDYSSQRKQEAWTAL